MEEKNNRVRKYWAAIIIVIAVVFIVIIVGIFTHWFGITEYPGKVIEQIDPISGEMLLEVNQEPEKSQRVGIIGLGEVIEQGFSAQQQDILTRAVDEYFNQEQFNYEYVSYKKNSFNNVDNSAIFNFIMESNTGDKYLVTLDTSGSYFKLEVDIESVN